MSNYKKLQTAFAQQLADNKAFVEQNIVFAENIAGDICTFLELPENDPKTDLLERPFQFLRPDPEKGFAPQETLRQAVISLPEGKFQFGLGVLLETGQKDHPKQVARFGVSCDRNGDRLLIDIMGKSFDILASVDSPLELGDVCQHVLDDLLRELEWRIGDEIEQTRIGFDFSALID